MSSSHVRLLSTLGEGLKSVASQVLTPPPASSSSPPSSMSSSAPQSSSPSAGATQPPPQPQQQQRKTTNHGELWLVLSDDPSFSRDRLRSQYRHLCAKAASGDFSPELLTVFDTIERDVARTLSGAVLEQAQAAESSGSSSSSKASGPALSTQEGRNRLRRLLAALAMHDTTVGYTQGLNFIAGFILISCPRLKEEDAFVLLVRLLQHPRYCMRDLYLPSLPAVGVNSLVLESLLEEHLPALASHLKSVGVPPLFFFEWWFSLFTLILPPALAQDAWTYFFADGWIAVFKLMIALLEHATPYILGKDFQGTVEGLKAYQQRRVALEFPELSNARHKAAAAAHAAGGGKKGKGKKFKSTPSSSSSSSSSSGAAAGAGADSSSSSSAAPAVAVVSEAALAGVRWLGDKLPSFITSTISSALNNNSNASSSSGAENSAAAGGGSTGSTGSSPCSLGIGPSQAPTIPSPVAARVVSALQGGNAAAAAKEWTGPACGPDSEGDGDGGREIAAAAPAAEPPPKAEAETGVSLSSSAESSNVSVAAPAPAVVAAPADTSTTASAATATTTAAIGDWVHVEKDEAKEEDGAANGEGGGADKKEEVEGGDEDESEEQEGPEESLFFPLELDPPPDLIRRAKAVAIPHARLEELIIAARLQVAKEKQAKEEADARKAAEAAEAAVVTAAPPASSEHPEASAAAAAAATAVDGQ